MKPRKRRLSEILDENEVPYAPLSERRILGVLITCPPKETRHYLAHLRAEYFSGVNRKVFSVLAPMLERLEEITLELVKSELDRHEILNDVGGAMYLVQLTEEADIVGNLPWHIEKVRGAGTRRDLMRMAIDLAGVCRNGHDLPELQEAATDLYSAALGADPEARRRCAPTRDLMDDYAVSVARGRERKLHTGLRALDEAIDGIAEGEVLTIVKRPQVGGSVAASQILLNAALEGEPCAFFSLEMPREQAFERMVQQRLRLTRYQVEEVAKENWKALRPEQLEALEAMSKAVVFVDRGKSGIGDLDASMMEASAVLGRPPRMVAIDYLGLLSSGSRNLPIYQRVSEAAVDVKSFAKRHRCAVILISQSGRDQDRVKTEGAGRLGIDAARDSGQVEEAADFVVTLWRPELDSSLSPEGKAEVKGRLHGAVVKSRRGPLVDLLLRFDCLTLRISEWGGPS